ncbi:GPI mannosyltransferase 2 [Nosema granulosis]|uniref:GPI mannosyltransferase 2 n=1 Tax=Nosema granulosis TaxID=83296 RepID=A0A9P6L0F5_9MICR|nr:GPI mannosyltransferase 2 [Nosema granulosis]
MNKTINYKRLAFNSFLSRIFYISICTLSHYFIPHYDLSTNLNDSSSIFIPLLKWDAVHFRDISENGYLQEHTLAFFPLLPYITRTFHIIINSIFHIINSIFPFRTGIEVFTIGIILNNLIFIINSLLLYKLTLYVFDFNTAIITFYLYIFNPASIICSSLYTESLFMLLFLISLFFLIMKREVYCTIVLSLSVLCRSNGILFCILLYRFRWNLLHFIALCIPIGLHQLYCLSKILGVIVFKNLFDFLEVFSNLPYKFSLKEEHLLEAYEFKDNLLSVVDTTSIQTTKDFITYTVMKIFIPYSYVQKKYWNQGFLKFFTFLNIPNMLIGLPFIVFSVYSFFIPLESLEYCYLINLLKTQLFLNTILSVFFFHWNTYFRFVSFNPIVYWTIAKIYLNSKRPFLFKLYLKYYLAFSVAYAILFGAFFPPA